MSEQYTNDLISRYQAEITTREKQLAACERQVNELAEINKELLDALNSIAAFSPGNGDVCEIIAHVARQAIARSEQ